MKQRTASQPTNARPEDTTAATKVRPTTSTKRKKTPKPATSTMYTFATTTDWKTNKRELVSGWASFLARFAWAHVAALTFKSDRGADGTRAAFRKWVRRLNMKVPGGVAYFVVFEQGPAGGLWHVHALVSATERMAADELQRLWLVGRSLVEPYRPGGGIGFYLAEKVAHGAEFEISKGLRELMDCPAA